MHETSTTPSVSVVIVFLNEQRFIEEAIESVLAQRFDDWELLLVDDGSTDSSGEIARRYQTANPGRIKYLTHPDRQNLGMSRSRNLGLEQATGRYIAYLDADDVWRPSKLAQQVAILDSHADCAMVYGATQFWHSWTGRLEDRKRDEIFLILEGMPLHTPVMPPTILAAYLVNEGACPNDPLIRREAAQAVGGFEDSFRGMYEDQAFYAKLCLSSAAIISDDCWFRYRRHEDSCVVAAHKAGHKHISRHLFLTWLRQYLSQHGFERSEIWGIVRHQLSLCIPSQTP